MTFDYPELLAVGIAVTVGLGAAVVVLTRRRRRTLGGLGLGTGRRLALTAIGVWLSVAAVALLSVAAAGPVASLPVPRTAGTVILAMDVSGSMAADDVKPNRLAAAQAAAREFVAAQPENVDIGVVAFEQGALTTARPSGDHAAALAAIDRLKVTGGTSLATAMLAALSAITGKNVSFAEDGTAPDIGYWPSATIVMFTDGEDQSGGDSAGTTGGIAAVAELAQKAGVQIHTVGVGTESGAPVTVEGFRVNTALDVDTLTAIADATGGNYQPVSDTAGLTKVADTIETRLTVEDELVPLAGVFIVAALALLTVGAIATILGSGRVI